MAKSQRETLERDQAMRIARDEILRRVYKWLVENGFVREGAGHYSKACETGVSHLGFQKLSGGRSVRVMSHFLPSGLNASTVTGPVSDRYTMPDSPNGRRYNFGWSTRECDIARCTDEYCRFLAETIIVWFDEQLSTGD